MTREQQTNKHLQIKEAWKVSKKYSSMLMNHIDSNDLSTISETIHNQYLSELLFKNLPNSSNKSYIQIWITMINTVFRNPKYDVMRASIRILHQTNVQRHHTFI